MSDLLRMCACMCGSSKLHVENCNDGTKWPVLEARIRNLTQISGMDRETQVPLYHLLWLDTTPRSKMSETAGASIMFLHTSMTTHPIS